MDEKLQYFLVMGFLLLLASLNSTVQAGEIFSIGTPATNISIPTGVGLVLNNDTLLPPSFVNEANWDLAFNTNFDPIDVVVSVKDSGGTTEYQVINDLTIPASAVGIQWTEFRVEIIDPSPPVGLDFDTGGSGGTFGFISLDGTSHSTLLDHAIIWDAPSITSTPLDLFFAIDIPDLPSNDNYTFTLRYTAIVPEPATNLILAILMVAAVGRRPRKNLRQA